MSISLFMPVLYLVPSEKEENRFLKMLPTPQINTFQCHQAGGGSWKGLGRARMGGLASTGPLCLPGRDTGVGQRSR